MQILEKAKDAVHLNGNTNGNTNGVDNPSTHSDALHVIIVGAGIGGLTAANYLRRQGHRTTVLEQSRFANETGAAVHLAPNSNGILRRIGINAEDFGANETLKITEYNSAGKLVKEVDVKEANKQWQHPWHLVHRIHLHEELKRRAITPDGVGEPAELRTSSRVVDVDTSSATVTLEGGEKLQGDLVIGADGVHSRTRAKVPGGDVKAQRSGKSAYRFLVTRKAVLEDPVTAKYAETHGELLLIFGTDRRIVMYPCANNELLNFVCIHPSSESDASGDEYNQVGNKDKLLKIYENFHPSLVAFVAKAEEETIKCWELLDLDPLQTWVDNKLALLGDAAHPYTPHQGQGAGQAMEDAAALAVVLPLGTKREEIPERLKLYESFRYDRATRIQDFSRKAGQDVPDETMNMMENTNYNFGHDEWDSATNKFRRWKWSKTPNIYWRMPVAFGPMPGPRQDFEGNWPRDASRTTAVTASLKFKTSRTVLENLFPNDKFKFASPGTVAYASFSQTTLNGMDWLGGGGYRHWGLYIHGVEFTKKDGSKISGTYMPLLFESLTDPIVTGREELGMPKLYCTLDIHRRAKSYRLQAGWEGATFGDVVLEGLEEGDLSKEQGTIGGTADDGIIVWRYIPQVGNRGKAEVEHAVFVPHAEEAKVVPTTVKRVFHASKGSVKFDPLDWEALPTLHHVVARLAEIPIYEVVGGKIVESAGVPDVSAARRVD